MNLRLGAAGLASGTLLGLAFATPQSGWLAWVALVPLLLAARGAGVGGALLAGFAAGLVAAFGTFSWLLVVPAVSGAPFIVLGCYLALYTACWAAAITMLAHGPLPLVVTAPAAWVALDAVRSHVGCLALPWGMLAQSQHADLALLQLAAWGGESAVTFVVVMGNVAIAAWIERCAGRPAGAAPASTHGAFGAGVAIALVHVAGALVMGVDAGNAQHLSVAAVQPAIGVPERDIASGPEANWQRLERLTRQAARAQAALIVWPETAVGDPAGDAAVGARLKALSLSTRSALVVGASEREKFAGASAAGLAVAQRRAFNSAYLVVGDARLGDPYRKRRLVPFGEYLPLRGSVTWPRWLVPELGDADADAGARGADFRVPADPAAGLRGGLRIGVLICWESLFANLSREAVRDGAELLVQLTDDSWFGHTRASAQHNAASVLRAVENHVPVVIASNAGPSQVIDANGRVRSRVPGLFESGVATASVAVGHGGTFFTRAGDLLAPASAALLGIAFLVRRRAGGAGRSSFTPLAGEHDEQRNSEKGRPVPRARLRRGSRRGGLRGSRRFPLHVGLGNNERALLDGGHQGRFHDRAVALRVERSLRGAERLEQRGGKQVPRRQVVRGLVPGHVDGTSDLQPDEQGGDGDDHAARAADQRAHACRPALRRVHVPHDLRDRPVAR